MCTDQGLTHLPLAAPWHHSHHRHRPGTRTMVSRILLHRPGIALFGAHFHLPSTCIYVRCHAENLHELLAGVREALEEAARDQVDERRASSPQRPERASSVRFASACGSPGSSRNGMRPFGGLCGHCLVWSRMRSCVLYSSLLRADHRHNRNVGMRVRRETHVNVIMPCLVCARLHLELVAEGSRFSRV